METEQEKKQVQEKKAREHDPVASLLWGLISMLQKILDNYIEKGEASITDVKLLIKGFLQLLVLKIRNTLCQKQTNFITAKNLTLFLF